MGDARDPALNAAIKASIVLLCAGAFLLIVMVVSGAEGDDSGTRALGSALTVVFFLLTATSGAALARRRPGLAWFGWLTAVLSTASLVGCIVAIWDGFGGESEGFGKALAISSVLSLAGAQASILLGPRFRDAGPRIRLLRNGTLTLLGALAALVVYAISAEGVDVDAKLVTVVVILYALGSLVLPLARRGTLVDEPAIATRNVLPADLLVEHGLEVVEGPVERGPEQGGGRWLRLRQADGVVVDLITYEQ